MRYQGVPDASRREGKALGEHRLRAASFGVGFTPRGGKTHPRFWEPSLPPSSSRAAARFPLRAVLRPGDLPGEIPPFYGP